MSTNPKKIDFVTALIKVKKDKQICSGLHRMKKADLKQLTASLGVEVQSTAKGKGRKKSSGIAPANASDTSNLAKIAKASEAEGEIEEQQPTKRARREPKPAPAPEPEPEPEVEAEEWPEFPFRATYGGWDVDVLGYSGFGLANIKYVGYNKKANVPSEDIVVAKVDEGRPRRGRPRKQVMPTAPAGRGRPRKDAPSPKAPASASVQRNQMKQDGKALLNEFPQFRQFTKRQIVTGVKKIVKNGKLGRHRFDVAQVDRMTKAEVLGAVRIAGMHLPDGKLMSVLSK